MGFLPVAPTMSKESTTCIRKQSLKPIRFLWFPVCVHLCAPFTISSAETCKAKLRGRRRGLQVVFIHIYSLCIHVLHLLTSVCLFQERTGCFQQNYAKSQPTHITTTWLHRAKLVNLLSKLSLKHWEHAK